VPPLLEDQTALLPEVPAEAPRVLVADAERGADAEREPPARWPVAGRPPRPPLPAPWPWAAGTSLRWPEPLPRPRGLRATSSFAAARRSARFRSVRTGSAETLPRPPRPPRPPAVGAAWPERRARLRWALAPVEVPPPCGWALAANRAARVRGSTFSAMSPTSSATSGEFAVTRSKETSTPAAFMSFLTSCCCSGSVSVTTVPSEPARAVRPERCR